MVNFTVFSSIEDKSTYEEWKKNELYKQTLSDTFTCENQRHGFVEFLIENEKIGPTLASQTFINCWHENLEESTAMWNLYTTSLEYGVAIKTTFGKLFNSLNNVENIKIGRVNYHNLDMTNPNEPDDVFWYKMLPYKHEQEVRAIIEELNTEEQIGKTIPVKLDVLIDEVYLSPTSKLWFKELVKDLIKKYRLNKEIFQSDLRSDPYR